MLDKFILAKLPLPFEIRKELKKFLQVPTPTARLMKQVSIEWYSNLTCVSGPGMRVYEWSGRWSSPPLRPDIHYSHRYRNVSYWHPRFWDGRTGEPIGRRAIRCVRVTWPALEPEGLPTWEYYTAESADQMARAVRSWTPVSI